ncbi:hypothetical protein LCL97_16065 [Seohaeicola saemankumensis]|nr:hypothetical protein [Seohaeicola saemankumensis]MCA0872350.1 hypothetical protein [Seohaeicola saemankumensis]
MSDTDSFIEEVTDEVRRDRMFAMIRRYGWIAVLVVVAIVGGAAWNEYRKASEIAAAQALGDAMIEALAVDGAPARAERLAAIQADSSGGEAIRRFMVAAARTGSDDIAGAVAALEVVAVDGDLPQVYRDIAAFKALTLQADTLSTTERRPQFEALAKPGAPLRLLAEEQLALLDIADGDAEAAISRFQAIASDAEADNTLRQRATQMIVALGGTAPTQQG